jgi:hypothetical protein
VDEAIRLQSTATTTSGSRGGGPGWDPAMKVHLGTFAIVANLSFCSQSSSSSSQSSSLAADAEASVAMNAEPQVMQLRHKGGELWTWAASLVRRVDITRSEVRSLLYSSC